MSIVATISANTFAIRELEAAVGELKARCDRRDQENEQLLGELDATSEQLYAMWKIVSDPEAISHLDELRAEALSLAGAQPNGPLGALDGEGRAHAASTETRPSEQEPLELFMQLQPLEQEPHQLVGEPEPAEPASEPEAVRLGPPVDFSGTWALTQSVNFKEYLEQTGVTWAKRQVAVKLRPVQEWSLASEDVWTFSMNTPIGRRTERIVVNGTVEDEIDGLHVLKESFYDRDELVTLCRPRDPAKQAIPHTEFRRRYDRAGDRMVLEIVTGKVSCTRIFERQRV
ncbi:hypothetical protein T492DRAFT_1017710 [Pavlovales sp. CCMP2436]|nr:hypothetical protein T492DRAFT_1017710 [Pavlovales sp. CCMP2436]|mmetsp:Transcript_44673/g.110767  ORF Transcript_44673/g.110767 Transcript_44673/m.110767 type:complete len:286 (-) Transcript_44673:214-1071(-)